MGVEKLSRHDTPSYHLSHFRAHEAATQKLQEMKKHSALITLLPTEREINRVEQVCNGFRKLDRGRNISDQNALQDHSYPDMSQSVP